MEHDSTELRAALEAECARVGVRLHDILPAHDEGAPGGAQESDRAAALALACLRFLPNNAGITAVLRSLDQSKFLQSIGQPWPRANDPELWPIADPRDEYDPPPPVPSMRDIAQHEDYLLAFVTSLTGDAATRDRALQRHGIYREYGKVVNAYLYHVGDGVEGMEALRRAAFLFWCSATQPACLTGVDELSEVQQKEVIEWLDDECAGGQPGGPLLAAGDWCRLRREPTPVRLPQRIVDVKPGRLFKMFEIKRGVAPLRRSRPRCRVAATLVQHEEHLSP